jgi:hypothetical protein
MDLSALVKLQGEIIDNIESNIKTAKNAVFSAEEDIIKSKKNMISARKVKFTYLEKMLYHDLCYCNLSCDM